MNKYKLKPLDEITRKIIDYRGKTPPKTDRGIRLITAKVVKDGFIQDNNYEYISDKTYEDWMTRGIPQKGDILITTEAPLGEVAQIRTKNKIALAQRIILLRGNHNIINQDYFFHTIKSPIVQNQLFKRATGTTVLGIKQSELKKIQIPIYTISKQTKIANILNAFDDLIENNTRRIEILEEMARLIYREWFVHFRFPGHEDVKMVDSELGKIPEGWEVKLFGDLVEYVRDSVKNEDVNEPIPVLGLGDMPKKSINLSEWDNTQDIGSTKLRFKKNDILFGKIRPYFHKVGIAQINGVCSSDIFVWRAKEIKDFVYSLLTASSDIFVETSVNSSSGTKMPRAKWEVLEKYQIVYPNKEILVQLNEVVGVFLKQIRVLSFQNKRLKETRDLLLPKLISGQINVESL